MYGFNSRNLSAANNSIETAEPLTETEVPNQVASAKEIETQAHLEELQKYLDDPNRLVSDLLCTTNQARQEAIAETYAKKNPGGLANFLLKAHSNLAPTLKTILITAVLKHLPQTSSYHADITALKSQLAKNIQQTFFGDSPLRNSAPSAQVASAYQYSS